MDISKLYAGLIVKNYPEMCRLTNMPIKKHSDAFDKELDRYVIYKKINGRAYVIQAIRPLPLHKKAQGLYGKLIETLILAALTKEKDLVMNTSYSELFQKLCMANENYKRIYSDDIVKILAEQYMDIDDDILYEFRRTSRKGMKTQLKNALNSMQYRLIITWFEQFKICKRKTQDNGFTYFEIVDATDDEVIDYTGICKEILRDHFHYSDMRQLYISRQYEDYKKIVNNVIKGLYGWEYVYKAVCIRHNCKNAQQDFEETRQLLMREADLANIGVNQEKLNKAITNMIQGKGKSNHEKAIEQLGGQWGVKNAKMSMTASIQAKDNYIPIWNFLTGYFVSSKADVSALAAICPIEEYNEADDDLQFGLK